MVAKNSKTIWIALGIGFMVIGVLEWRRTSLPESYWLFLAGLVCLLVFQYLRLRAMAREGKSPVSRDTATRSGQPRKKTKK